jgi:hypothetical protein
MSHDRLLVAWPHDACVGKETVVGLSVVRADYSGKVLERVDDPKNLLHRFLPPSDEDSGSLLAKIDWYGDTYFNYLQLKLFLQEWDQLEQRAKAADELEIVDAVRRLARQCREDRTLLRFIGD